MQVILLRDISGVGQKGSVKNVSDGHAVNFLIPNRMAEAATPEKLKAYEKEQKEHAAEAAAKDVEWRAIVKEINGKKLTIPANAGKQGHLYEKISGDDIQFAITNQWKIALPKQAVHPKMAIKQTGEWPVEVKLGAHTAAIIVVVETQK